MTIKEYVKFSIDLILGLIILFLGIALSGVLAFVFLSVFAFSALLVGPFIGLLLLCSFLAPKMFWASRKLGR